jgi:DNA-binding CsgD family transcriptional regulator/tetratricopeptide (TPR) repeat protein
MEMESAIERAATCPILVGRGLYMEVVRTRLENAAAGSGSALVVAAEAGIGKSCLVREAAKVARRTKVGDRGFLVLQGGCFETEQSLPYAPIIDLLRALLLSGPPEAAGSILDAHASDLVRLLPEMAARLPHAQPVTSTPSLGPEGDKHRLISTLTSLFAHLASAQPLMIALEDLHWSDDLSLEFLLHLARRIPQQRILLIATYRNDETRPGLLHTLAELDRERLALEMRLAPLSLEEVDAMLQAIFDLHRPVQLDFLNEIYELTEGNPFFIEEILKSLLSSGDIVYADIVRDRNSLMGALVPRTVQDAVQRRSRLLSAEARRMLALAAVLGRRFSFDLLLELLQSDEAQLLGLIKECIRAQLITEESAELFAFRHELTRQAIYSELLARERKTLHGQIARKLEQSHEQPGEGRRARPELAEGTEITEAELAHHSYEAGMWEQARDHACQAGEEAQTLFAHGAAVACFSMALDAIKQLAATPRSDLYRARGLSYGILGDFDAALADHTEALRLAREAGNRHDEWQSLLDLAALWSTRDYRQTNLYSSVALDLARSMDDASTLAHTLNRVGNWWMNAYEPDDARRYHEEALAIFQRLDQRPGIADTLGLLGFSYLFGLDLVNGADYLSQAIELCRETDDRLGAAYYLGGLTLCAPSYATDTAVPADMTLQEAISKGEEALQIARETSWRSGESFANVILSDCTLTLGDYGAAAAFAQTSLDIARDIEHAEWIVSAQYVLGMLHTDISASPQAIHYLEEALAGARKIGSIHWQMAAGGGLALALVANGDLLRAGSILDSVMKEDTPPRAVGQRICWVARAELALVRFQPKTALEIADKLLSTAYNLSEERTAPRLLKLRGDALAMLGKATRADAEADLLRAISASKEQGLMPLFWRLNLSLGNLYRSQGNRTAATNSYSTARALAEQLAATIKDESSNDGFPRNGLKEDFLKEVAKLLPQPRPLSAARAAKEALGGLTAREREVAVLVSRGCTNRQIGDQLHITEETAAVHVRNILSKLNFTSRVQIAAWAALAPLEL